MFKIIVGCYEQFLLGYKVNIVKESDNDESNFALQFQREFSDHSNLGCIKCVASNDVLVASGSSDESITLYDMKTSCDLGPLQGHSGSINEVIIPDKSGTRIVSCSDDGTICIWEGGKKKGLLKTLGGHQGPIQTIAVHPSGKLAMSASVKDGTLRTWNMISGRIAFIKNTKRAQIEFVRWSPSGNYYVTASSRFIQIYKLSNAKCVMEMETSRPLYTINFIPFVCSTTQTEYCVVGDSAGYISLYSVPQGSLIANFKAHDKRIKGVHGFIPNMFKEASHDEVWLATVSSDEKIKLWRFDMEVLKGNRPEAECLLSIDASARLTCVTVWQEATKSERNTSVEAANQTNDVANKPQQLEENVKITSGIPASNGDQGKTMKKSKKTKRKEVEIMKSVTIKKGKRVSFDSELTELQSKVKRKNLTKRLNQRKENKAKKERMKKLQILLNDV